MRFGDLDFCWIPLSHLKDIKLYPLNIRSADTAKKYKTFYLQTVKIKSSLKANESFAVCL